MSRLHNSHKKSRQSLFPTARNTQQRPHPDDTYQESPLKKKKGYSRSKTTVTAEKRRNKKVAIVLSDDELTSPGDTADDEADEEDDSDNDDEPAVSAPSRITIHEAGLLNADLPDNLSMFSDNESMFHGLDDLDFDPIKAQADADADFEQRVFAEDDDEDLYNGVEVISDSDPEMAETKELAFAAEMFQQEHDLESLFTDDPAALPDLNHIEGLSAYGFGDSGNEGTLQFGPSSQSSDENTEVVERRVRFEDTFPESRSAFMRLSESPTMTRALLPSALPNAPRVGDDSATASDSDEYDSDATAISLPPQSVQMSSQRTCQIVDPRPADREGSISSSTPEPQKKTPKLNGPPRGTFFDDGEKPAGILDATGKIMVITNPQHLGEQFAKRYGQSAPSSPGMGLAEASFGDNSQLQPPPAAAVPDPMIASLNTGTHGALNGQAEGPPHAFYPTLTIDPEFAHVFGLASNEAEVSDVGDFDLYEDQIRLGDLVKLDSDSESESPTSPMLMSGELNATPRNGLLHMTTSNVTAFRRNADPAFAAALQSSPSGPLYSQFITPKSKNRKRKARHDSPYNRKHYEGVTPVQRTTRSQLDLMNDSPGPSKRRRTLTT